MPRIVFLHPNGSRTECDGIPGESLMVTARNNGVAGIEAECGGTLSCATCHVYIEAVTPGGLPEPSPEEDEMLSGVAAERRENSRLSCQITLTEELTEIVARLPERQL